MKIKYNLNEKYSKYYNEANGIYLSKKKLKKKPNTKTRGYIQYLILQIIIIFIAFIVLAAICMNLDLQTLSDFIIDLGCFAIAIYGLLIYMFIVTTSNYKIGNKEGTLEISENGIKDMPKSGIEIKLPYSELDLIVVTNNIIVFFSNTPIMIIVNKNNLDENAVINEIKKFSDVPIIVKTNKKTKT